MDPSLVLFDVDGTLVDCAGAGRRALELAFRTVFGVDGIGDVSRRVRFEGRTDPTIIAALAAEAGIPAIDLARRRGEILRAYLLGLSAELERPDPKRRIMPGVPELLEALRSRPGVHLGLLTGNVEDGARAKLERFGLNRYFPSGGFGSDDPDRIRIARLAREKLARATGSSFPVERVSVIGDTELDVACAHANGYRAVAVASGFVPRERLEAARPDALFADLTPTDAVLEALGLGLGTRP